MLKTDKVVDKCLIFCFFMCLLTWEKPTEAKRGTGTENSVIYWTEQTLTTPQMTKPLFFLKNKKYKSKNISVLKQNSFQLSDQNNSIKGAHFRDVLQEMHNRRNLGRGKKTASRNRSQAEVKFCCSMFWLDLDRSMS